MDMHAYREMYTHSVTVHFHRIRLEEYTRLMGRKKNNISQL